MAKNLRPSEPIRLMLSGGASEAGLLSRGEGTVTAGDGSNHCAGLALSALQASDSKRNL